MKAVWHNDAKAGRDQVAEYVGSQFGKRSKMAFLQKVRQEVQLLRRSPDIGQIDPLFAERAQTYRSVIINGLNKLVYRTEGDNIHIVGFWDTRMDEKRQAAQTE